MTNTPKPGEQAGITDWRIGDLLRIVMDPNAGLSRDEAWLILALADYRNNKKAHRCFGMIFPSMRELAKKARMDVRHVRRILNRLTVPVDGCELDRDPRPDLPIRLSWTQGSLRKARRYTIALARETSAGTSREGSASGVPLSSERGAIVPSVGGDCPLSGDKRTPYPDEVNLTREPSMSEPDHSICRLSSTSGISRDDESLCHFLETEVQHYANVYEARVAPGLAKAIRSGNATKKQREKGIEIATKLGWQAPYSFAVPTPPKPFDHDAMEAKKEGMSKDLYLAFKAGTISREEAKQRTAMGDDGWYERALGKPIESEWTTIHIDSVSWGETMLRLYEKSPHDHRVVLTKEIAATEIGARWLSLGATVQEENKQATG